jgi:hypothetical protein
MADDLRLLKDAERGARARLLLESEPYKEAAAKVRQGIIEKWATSPVMDKEGQHELRLMLKLLDDLEGNIRSVANDGKMAEEIISRQKEQESRLKRVIKGVFR